MTPRCVDCPRPVSAGRTGGPAHHVRCLICETARLFRGWFYPASLSNRRGAPRSDNAPRTAGEGERG